MPSRFTDPRRIPTGRVAAGRTLLIFGCDGDLAQHIALPEDQARAVAFSPDGQRIATGDSESVIYVWSLATGTLLKTLRGHGGAVLSLTWSPDGSLLVSTSQDTTALVWDVLAQEYVPGTEPGALAQEYAFFTEVSLESFVFDMREGADVVHADPGFPFAWSEEEWVIEPGDRPLRASGACSGPGSPSCSEGKGPSCRGSPTAPG